jgi:hypothetical protein
LPVNFKKIYESKPGGAFAIPTMLWIEKKWRIRNRSELKSLSIDISEAFHTR